MAFIDQFDSKVLEPSFVEVAPYHEYHGSDSIGGVSMCWQRCLIDGTDCLIVLAIPELSNDERGDIITALQARGNYRGFIKVGAIVHIFYVNVDETNVPL